MTDEQPRYRHDCTACVFLGTFRAHDLYFCEQRGHAARVNGPPIPTVIARYGHEPPAYTSGLVLAEFDCMLAEALRRATERQLIQ